MKKVIYGLLLFHFSLIQAAPLTDINWQGESFMLFSRGTPLAYVIRDFARNYNVPVVVSDKITDQFSGKIRNQSPEEILTNLSRYGISWYYVNGVLYANKVHELTNTIIPLNTLTPEDVKQYLSRAQILDDNVCSINSAPGIHAIEVWGVPECLNRVSKLTRQLDANVTEQYQTRPEVGLFPLKYASASDTMYEYRSQNVTVPGLVSILNNMNRNVGSSALGANPNTEVTHGKRITFSADQRKNAVIVKGTAAEIATYGKLIKQLDTPTPMIEISVSIIDINASEFKQLGVQYSAANGVISFNSSTVSSGVATVVDSSDNFLVEIKALEKKSKAKILSRPTIVTLNNVQAILDRNITFYTKVQSRDVASLESVTTGSLLRVTPRLVEEDGQEKIMLSLNIQDGQQASAISSTEPLPQVQSSEISTQATLKSGESLLIGGFVQDKDELVNNKIPLLGDLPLIGSLFRSEEHNIQKVVRVFLIKAQPISLRD
ncbi:EscC/YscC/HrcC family type III secretion system outer membrane ring protein [Shewanella surugensis]|uniref:Type 3 secretion system secretin n=1 Tax=Shewanella surugensis TaxID=212020 RepID=A0ABT0L7N2_9GAMM|nr:EscC/YscC/HrcC family type III secretion system outer membrane ring protein [Shewanella surugensis]MCL1123704.1 EscC/YscC/HrcC family type III secretion system outer membrane ring protein [Shewanella surugensis]